MLRLPPPPPPPPPPRRDEEGGGDGEGSTRTTARVALRCVALHDDEAEGGAACGAEGGAGCGACA